MCEQISIREVVKVCTRGAVIDAVKGGVGAVEVTGRLDPARLRGAVALVCASS